MAQAKGGRKLVRGTRHKFMYERQFHRTEANKHRRHNKRLAKRDAWRLKGIKKNGSPVRNAVR